MYHFFGPFLYVKENTGCRASSFQTNIMPEIGFMFKFLLPSFQPINPLCFDLLWDEMCTVQRNEISLLISKEINATEDSMSSSVNSNKLWPVEKEEVTELRSWNNDKDRL